MKAKQFTVKLTYEAFIKAIGFKGEKLDRLIIQSKSFNDSWRKESVYVHFGDGPITNTFICKR